MTIPLKSRAEGELLSRQKNKDTEHKWEEERGGPIPAALGPQLYFVDFVVKIKQPVCCETDTGRNSFQFQDYNVNGPYVHPAHGPPSPNISLARIDII